MNETASDLWVLPPAANSAWFAKIDWYLNWQLCKGLAHEARRPSVELLRVTEENGLPWFDPPRRDDDVLMVAAQGRLPTHRCIVLKYAKDDNDGKYFKTWLQQIRELSLQMKLQKLRVFLPATVTVTEANEIWRSFSSSEINIEFTADEDHNQWPTQSKTS